MIYQNYFTTAFIICIIPFNLPLIRQLHSSDLLKISFILVPRFLLDKIDPKLTRTFSVLCSATHGRNRLQPQVLNSGLKLTLNLRTKWPLFVVVYYIVFANVFCLFHDFSIHSLSLFILVELGQRYLIWCKWRISNYCCLSYRNMVFLQLVVVRFMIKSV